MKKYFYIIICFSVLSCSYFHGDKVDFNNDIRPIINNKCMDCHGGVRAKGDLSFLFRESALIEGKSGNIAIVPFNANKSELIKRIKHDDPELRMPLEAPALSEEEISLFEKWINQGAVWGTHWAYIPPENRINPPNIGEDWAYNEIDNFIYNRMKEQGLEPSLEAEKSDILRRVSLDIIGLPPSPDIAEIFLKFNDKKDYELLIDQLLSSEHFGEKWASMWLDLARYADSRGYQKDILRPHIWRYRDWVIKAFNDDMPFDQFTIEQLAGDLIEERSDSKLLATAFHRNTMTNDEGGTKDEEFRLAAVMDRLNSTMEIWQGTTMACVQCHSHPYDPIKHEEYYEMLSFFNNTEDNDEYSDGPKASLLSPIEANRKADLAVQIEKYKSVGDTLSKSYQSALENYIRLQPRPVPILKEFSPDSSRKTVVFEKGNWLVHGPEVSSDTPSFLPKMREDLPKNRLGLAKWLVSSNNPLTARVMVNRIWEQIFGQGLVTTLGDFGTQSQFPSHPELLDWLALRFITVHQWSLKSLIKEIVTSKTYRLSSAASDDQLTMDPYNVYLSRGSRYRLSAEQIRDQALSVSGLLNSKVYGKSVMPAQPDGVWNVIRHVAKWEKSEDGDQHRRGLYTFWRRVSPYPSMMSFDVPSREFCVSQRIKTNTPIQALITLNDPVFVEAAQALAQKMMEEGGDSSKMKISYGFKRALFKMPNEERLTLLVNLFNGLKEKNYSEKEAMQQVASVILNLDELIMRT